MRLLLINSEYPPVGGGAGNATANIAREFVRLGNQVLVVTAAFGDLPRDSKQDGLRILRGPTKRKNADRSTAGEQALFVVGATIRALQEAPRFKPDAVLAFFGLPSGAAALVLKKIVGVPYIVSLRGGDVPGFRPYDFWLYHRIAVPFLRVIWHEASAVVANSEGLRRLALAFDGEMEIPIIPNGVDFERFSAPDRDWTSPRLLSVGRIVHQKGLDLAVAALADLRDLPWQWRIAGDGPQLEPLKAVLTQDGLADRVQFLGWMSPEALAEEYGNASLFLFPSRHEGMPNALLEAMASGLPAIATRIAGNEELVVDGETGILVPPEDSDELRGALRRLLGDGEIRRRMGAAARQRAAAKYSWSETAKRYQALLLEVIG